MCECHPRAVTDPLVLRSGPAAAAIRERRLIAVLRGVAPRDRLLALVDALVEDGITILEITLDAPGAAADLAAVRAQAHGSAVVGAGTIRTPAHVGVAIESG